MTGLTVIGNALLAIIAMKDAQSLRRNSVIVFPNRHMFAMVVSKSTSAP